MLNLGLAFGEEHMRIPTADEVGFIKKWHAILMGMVDPVLDCQGIMRADDGTPMFRFGYPDAHNPSIIWRNHTAYHVGEHFWEKGGRLYRDTDLTHPVLDLFGEAPLTFAERAAMHDCPTLPGLGSPCQVALNLPALRQKVARGDSPVQVALAEDAQILACLNHVSPLKAAAMFTAIQAALGPLLAKLPQVARWPNPAAPPIPTPSAPAALAAAPSKAPPSQPSGPPKVAAPPHPTDYRGQRNRFSRKLGRPVKPAKSDEPAVERPHLPSLPGWPGEESSRAVAENTPPAGPSHQGTEPRPATPTPSSSTQAPGQTPPPPTVAQSEPAPKAVAKALQANQPPSPPATSSDAAEPIRERRSQEPEPAGPLCGTYCRLSLGAVGTGLLVAGGVEVTKDAVILGAVAGGESMGISVAGAAGGAVVGTIVVDGVADHVMPPSAPTEPARPASPEKPASSADNTARGESANQPAPKRGTFKGDLTRLQKEATTGPLEDRVGAQGELDAIERLLQEGKNVEKLPERGIKGQTDPDLLVDGELREIKTRAEPLNENWAKRMIEKANDQIKDSQYGEKPQGSVDLQLRDQVASDSELLQKAEEQVRRQFKVDRSRSLTSVRIYHEGRLLAEWSRVGDKVVKVISTLP